MGDRRRGFPFWVPLFFGLICLTNVLTKPRISTYHVPDVILLVMGGFMLGTAITGLVALKRTRSDQAVR
jgi:hypothetical protein